MADSDYKRHTRYRAAALAGGAVPLGGLLRGDAAEALRALLASGYADSKAGVIARALLEAAQRARQQQMIDKPSRL